MTFVARPAGLIVAAAVVTSSLRTGAADSPIGVDDLMRLRSINEVRISPAGDRVAYVASVPSLPKNEHDAALFVVSVNGGEPARLGDQVRIFNTPSPRPQIRWMPDGSAVSLLAFDGPRPQVVSLPLDGGAPRTVTRAAEGVFAYEWSPDGKSLAYITRDPLPAEEARQRQDRSFVIRADAPTPATRLAVQQLDGTPRLLTPPSQHVDALSWSPDGRAIAYSAAPRTGFTAAYEARVYTVPIDGRDPRAIVDRPGMNTGPRFSPDGKQIAFISTDGQYDVMASRSLTIVAAGGGPPRRYGLDDAWVNEYAWAPDSRSLYLMANDGTFGRGEHMFEQPILRLHVADGRLERSSAGPTVAFSISASADGRRIAYKSVEPRTMGDVAVLDTASGRATTITSVNPQLRDFAVGDLKPISWRSFDGMEIWGLLLTPFDSPPTANERLAQGRPSAATAGRRLPTLVYIHGGPGGGVTYGLFPQFMTSVPQVDPYPTAAMAGLGYAVLFPMPRGGAGYGEKGQRAIVGAWGEGDYKDIIAGVDHLVAQGIADPDRLGVMGASYGGYMTNWIVTQTSRFKAASSGASLSDLSDTFYLSEGGEFMIAYFKRPWENRESYAAHSPLTFADRVTTPLLIQHGEADPRVPVAGAWKFYRTLKAMGKTVELEIYPRGGHVLREPMQQREQMRRNLEWFTKWIRPS